MRALIFLITAAVGLGVLLWAAGGIHGPRTLRTDPHLEQNPDAGPGGAPLPLQGSGADAGVLRLDGLEGPRYAMPEARVFRDPASGERVEIEHFLPWAFSARAGRAVPGADASRSALQFEDVVVRTYREPETLAEARRLRDDPRAIDDFVRLELLAQRARADGIAGYLDAERKGTAAAGDAVILLDGDVRVHDRSLGVLARGASVAFDPRSHRAVGTGPFTVVHAAWSLEGEDFVLSRSPSGSADRRSDAFRIEVARRVFLAVDAALLDDEGRPLWSDPAAFRPARVFAGRATVAHDGAGPSSPLRIVLEDGVRALQEGGRRMLGDRLSMALEPREPPADGRRAGWTLAHLSAEGRPVTLEVPDLPAATGAEVAVRLSGERLRYEPSPFGPPTTVLEGSPVVLFEGELALAGGTGSSGRWLRASASERAVLAPMPAVAQAPDGTPVAGRRIELHGAARIERRGPAEGRNTAYEDVLEADEITLVLRPGPRDGQELPVSFAALGHVRLSGTRLEGAAERIVAERLDEVEPMLTIDGQDTRLALLGFGRDQRLFGAEQADGADAGSEPVTEQTARRSWSLERLEADGSVEGSTSLGGPAVGVPAWLEAAQVAYDRVTDRVALLGAPGHPARVEVEAGPDRRHGLRAPRIAFERERARLSADDGVSAEVHLGGGASGLAGAPVLPAGLEPLATSPSDQGRTLTLYTDGRLRLRLRLAGVGGEPQPDAPQVVEILAPFRAELAAARSGPVDRVRADRLSVEFALRDQPAADRPTRVLARPAAPREPSRRGASSSAPGPQGALERWALTSRTLALTLEAGELETFEAQGGTTLESPRLHVGAERLRFARRLGALVVEGGARPVDVRMGPATAESRLTATAIHVTLDERGPRWISATGPFQGVLFQADATRAGRTERLEVACSGDVRLVPEELVTLASTWVRRTERASERAPWTGASEIWTDRLAVRGRNLLPRDGGEAAREIDTILAEGSRTALRSGEGRQRVEMWCERLEVDVPSRRAVLSGAPGTDVLVQFETGYDVELARASFDFSTGEVRDLEAGRVVLRRER